MKSLPRPTRAHEALFDACVAATTAAGDVTTLIGIKEAVLNAGTQYAARGLGDLWQVQPLAFGDPEKVLSRSLYARHLVGGELRNVYEEIRRSAKQCPFCLFGEVYEVDHFLPKGRFSEFSILPDNLVPICHPCNHKKLSKSPIDADNYFLHPYFDVLPEIQWLFGDVVLIDGGPVVRYRVALDAIAFGHLSGRLVYQFYALKLDERFTDSAAAILAEIEEVLTGHLGALSADEIAEHFKSEGDRYFGVHGNCLEAAAFYAAASNREYCSGAYRN